MSDPDLTVEVWGEAYLFEETLLEGPKEVCLETAGESHTVETEDGTTIRFEVLDR